MYANQEKRKSKRHWLLSAIAAVPVITALTAAPAHAQFRVGEDGRANEASNRVGSGGYNAAAVNHDQPTVSGNQIVTGNVTAGRQFHDSVGYTDPRSFRGPSAGILSDSFVRSTASAPLRYQPGVDLATPRPFYGDARAVPPPSGTIREGFSGGYIGTSATPSSPLELSNTFSSPLLEFRNERLGSTQFIGNRSSDITNGTNGGLGDLSIVGGGLDNSNPTNYLSASSLYGVREFRSGANADSSGLSDFGTGIRTNGDRFGNADLDIRQMRAELEANSTQGLSPNAQQNSKNGSNPNAGQNNGNPTNDNSNNNGNPSSSSPNGITPGAMNTAIRQGNAIDASVSGKPLNSPLESGVATNEGTRPRLVGPAQQSGVYRQLQQRSLANEQNESGNPQLNDPRDVMRMNQQRRAQAQERAAREAQQGGGNPDATPRGNGDTGVRGNGARSETHAPTTGQGDAHRVPPTGLDSKPVQVSSLAAGVAAPGLHKLLADAEQSMKDGKFSTAVQNYNTAERVAPNNPLIPLGRAHAELAAGYYGQAEMDLRRVYAADPVLLEGQYDLNAVISKDRMQQLTKDLQTLVRQDKKLVRPAFLLAYINYNTGKEAEAADYLSQAEQRAGRPDPVLQLMRKHWKLPGSAPSGNAAKSGKADQPETTDQNK